MPWLSYRELRRIERERREAVQRADASEKYARGVVNSLLTSKGVSGVPVVAPTERDYTPPPRLPDTVQGWTQEEFVTDLVSDGSFKSRAEALEAFKLAQTTGKFPYQKDEEFVS